MVWHYWLIFFRTKMIILSIKFFAKKTSDHLWIQLIVIFRYLWLLNNSRFNWMSLLISAEPEVSLPESLTTLEWLNRSGKFLRIMPKLRCLVNLEYLMLGHAEFLDAHEFDSFLQVISSENLPKLQYLVSPHFLDRVRGKAGRNGGRFN